MSKILWSAPLVDQDISRLIARTQRLAKTGYKPRLAIILVGTHPASLSYIESKKKMCAKVGAEFDLLPLAEDVSESTFLKAVEDSNNDPHIDGVLIQLPLPPHLAHIDTVQLVSPEKDVDGFSAFNTYQLFAGHLNKGLVACTPKGIVSLCDFYKIPLKGRKVVIIGRSLIVGRPLALLLTARDATVCLCHSQTKNLREETKTADIIVSAVGIPGFVDASYLSPTKKPVVIDVGISRDQHGKLRGDVDFEAVQGKVEAITPVPGGVGPMTVFSLIDNLLIAAEKRRSP